MIGQALLHSRGICTLGTRGAPSPGTVVTMARAAEHQGDTMLTNEEMTVAVEAAAKRLYGDSVRFMEPDATPREVDAAWDALTTSQQVRVMMLVHPTVHAAATRPFVVPDTIEGLLV